MSEGVSNIVYLTVAAITLLIFFWKVLALFRDATPTLALTVAMFLCASVVYTLASPAGYTALGEMLGQPSFATLPVYLGIMACFAFLHLITFLWDPQLRTTPSTLHRKVARWGAAYGASALCMIGSFSAADLAGPADPLRFNTSFANDPYALLFLGVFLLTLSSGTLNTHRRCQAMKLDDPQLRHSLRAFSGAMLGIFGYVVCNAPAISAAALGIHALDTVGAFGSAFGAFGTVIMCYGLSGAALGAWLDERHDIKALNDLWQLVVAGVDPNLAFVPSSRHHHPSLWNTTFNLHRVIIEILDGIRVLRPWVPDEAAKAADALRTSPMRQKTGTDLESAMTAVMLVCGVAELQKHLIAQQELAVLPLPPANDGQAPRLLPGDGTRAGDERARLLRLARALESPLVKQTAQQTLTPA
ncbi:MULTISPECIES: MAB_1171c family putative transporter [unclassified Streptomyces]|uniref:MAB_1171c family putative transporter n=1 Tax=unclassified Streptomyces TaxID=2593676 RepID=UPI0037FB1602